MRGERANYDIFVNGKQTLSLYEENVENSQTEEVNSIVPESQISDSSNDLLWIFVLLGFVGLMIWVSEDW